MPKLDNWLPHSDNWLPSSDNWLTESDNWLPESDNCTGNTVVSLCLYFYKTSIEQPSSFAQSRLQLKLLKSNTSFAKINQHAQNFNYYCYSPLAKAFIHPQTLQHESHFKTLITPMWPLVNTYHLRSS